MRRQLRITVKHRPWHYLNKTGANRYGYKTHIFVRPMWEHRRLVVVHAFISEVVIDYLDELYKFLSSTKHAFCHLKRERESKAVVNDGQEREERFQRLD